MSTSRPLWCERCSADPPPLARERSPTAATEPGYARATTRAARATATARRSRSRPPSWADARDYGAPRWPANRSTRWCRRTPAAPRSPRPRSRSERPARGRLAVRLLQTFLIFLAANAQRGLQARFQSLQGDGVATVLTDTERAVADLRQRVIDLLEEDLLAPAQAKRERLQVLRRREVHLVRHVVRVERHVLIQRTLRVAQNLLFLGQQDVLKPLQVFSLECRLFHRRSPPATWRCPGSPPGLRMNHAPKGVKQLAFYSIGAPGQRQRSPARGSSDTFLTDGKQGSKVGPCTA